MKKGRLIVPKRAHVEGGEGRVEVRRGAQQAAGPAEGPLEAPRHGSAHVALHEQEEPEPELARQQVVHRVLLANGWNLVMFYPLKLLSFK